MAICGLTVASVISGSTAESQSNRQTAADPSFMRAIQPQRVIPIDMNDPDDVRLLEELTETEEGLTFQITPKGWDGRPTPGPERAALDADASRDDNKVRTPACPDLPRLARSSNARAFLGCDQDTAEIRQGSHRAGSRGMSVAHAMLEALGLAESSLADEIEVIDRDGNLTVNLPIGAIRAQSMSEAADVDRRLLLTAYSHQDVRSVQLTVGGDCLQYAYLTAGDTCSVVSMDDLGMLMID